MPHGHSSPPAVLAVKGGVPRKGCLARVVLALNSGLKDPALINNARSQWRMVPNTNLDMHTRSHTFPHTCMRAHTHTYENGKIKRACRLKDQNIPQFLETHTHSLSCIHKSITNVSDMTREIITIKICKAGWRCLTGNSVPSLGLSPSACLAYRRLSVHIKSDQIKSHPSLHSCTLKPNPGLN